MIRVLFVCMGNICRSPMAEAVFRDEVERAGLAGHFQISSAGTSGWHVGEPAHPGTQAVLHRQGIHHAGSARQVAPHDLRESDYVIAMDSENIETLRRLDRQGILNGKLHRLLEFAPESDEDDVPDPYYEGNFDHVYQLVRVGSRGLIDHIRAEHDL